MNAPGTAAPGLLLHLAGPLQSWGTRSHYNERDTAPHPTRSGIIGLLGACLGRTRDESIEDLTRLSLTTRTDRPGVLLRDLHTVGGGLPAKATVTTAEGKKRPPSQGTLLSHRSYLADAAFTVCLTGDLDTLRTCEQALRTPRWPPYLGRRSCPPAGPLLLGLLPDPLHHLVHLPLARSRPRGDARVDFHSDSPLDQLPTPRPPEEHTPNPEQQGAVAVSELNDDPHGGRAFRARALYRRTLPQPADQCAGLGTDYLTALTRYLDALPSEGAAQ
ncbi:type I-E CRISPR-associated protein Cas5/CasD [Streptomyces sp. NPDC048612]|uniref:type I-E CRISPR-associated protein Cas5/CasD n=1 Tax=Streptomyces sp. NPDC048612 TaxID=3365579 RepID=UPI00371663C9